jgi:hypothetical protein
MASLSNKLRICQICDLEIQFTMLLRTVNFAWAADFEVDFSKMEAVS